MNKVDNMFLIYVEVLLLIVITMLVVLGGYGIFSLFGGGLCV